MTTEALDVNTAGCQGKDADECDGAVTEIWIVLLSDPSEIWGARPHGFTLCAGCAAEREWQNIPHRLRIHGFAAGATRVVVDVNGGLVQDVRVSGGLDVDVEVRNYDVSEFPHPDEGYLVDEQGREYSAGAWGRS